MPWSRGRNSRGLRPSRINRSCRDNMKVLGQGLKQLFHQQRKRFSHSSVPSSSSSSSSSVVPAGGASPTGSKELLGPCCYDSDCLSAPVVPPAAGQCSAAAGMMKRGTSLQSRRSKGSNSGSGSGDRDPLLRGSPQAPRRRNTHDPQQHTSRPRSSSTTDTTPSSPTPAHAGGDVVLSSGYQSTEETDRVGDSQLITSTWYISGFTDFAIPVAFWNAGKTVLILLSIKFRYFYEGKYQTSL